MQQPDRRGHNTAYILSGIGFLILAVLFWKGPWLLDKSFLKQLDAAPKVAMITGFRTALVAFGLATAAAVGSVLTWKNLQETRQALKQTELRDQNQHTTAEANLRHTKEKDDAQHKLAREGQVTERYVKAVGLLAADSKVSQLGGIYALERIMGDSPEDSATIVQLLAGYIRASGRVQRVEHEERTGTYDFPATVEEADRAAFTVIARRGKADVGAVSLNFRRANLAGASLKGINTGALFGADFTGAKLNNSVLAGASLFDALFSGANLRRAVFDDCDLRRAQFDEHADLRGASFARANMRGANLRSAQLRGAWLTDADITGADFTDAHLMDDRGGNFAVVTAEQLLQARVTSTTVLPPKLAAAPGMQEHIDRCTEEFVAGVKHGEAVTQ